MPTPGYVFKDGGAIPDSDLTEEQRARAQSHPGGVPASAIEPATSSPSPSNPTPTAAGDPPAPSSHESKLAGLADGATDSHALAAADHEEKGAAQQEHFETEVKDLGWSEHPKSAERLVGGLKNEELWLLVRRFDKQMYHVKAMKTQPLAGLDLNIADEDDFSPDKLRANVERLYMTVIVGLVGFGKHIARLRSWREPRRTAAFAAAYAIGWIFDLLMPLLFTTLTVLILVPQSRDFMFPPAPLALVDPNTGGIQKPPAGVLGSHDSITGAPERHQGEAVEQEASNFVAGIGTIAMSSATGKHEPAHDGEDPLSSSTPDPTAITAAGADANKMAAGGESAVIHDKTKQPMEDAMWTKMRPIMHIVGDIADGWERFANALSPTSPFSKVTPKLKLASIVAPGIFVSMVTSSYIFAKMNWFVVGFGFFGDPIISRGLHYLNKRFPNWQKLLEIRNSILKGVPTNAQLTITLLRIGEANRAPLPPPPRSSETPPSTPASLNGDELTMDASNAEIHDAIHADPNDPADTEPTSPPKKKHGSKVLGFLKGTTKAGVETKLGSDTLKAKAGSKTAKNHLGAVPSSKEQLVSGPVDFQARYKGTKGWAYVNTSATIPCISFSKHQSNGTGEQSKASLDPVFSIPIEEIEEIKKIGGFGWKAKLIIGWATDKTVLDGIEITEKNGNKVKMTAIALREELFNRLVAMGGQKWESW